MHLFCLHLVLPEPHMVRPLMTGSFSSLKREKGCTNGFIA